MIMYSDSRSFLSRCALLALLVTCCAAQEACNKSKCPGPLGHYRMVQCKPIYKNPDDCCAEAYDCSHLEKMSKDKCYANGHEYSIGEKLKQEDSLPCDNTVCAEGEEGKAAYFHFTDTTECPEVATEENCYIRKSLDTCCSTTRVCLAEGEKRATCEVDGRIYNDGDLFMAYAEPDFDCVCLPGYTGENVEPFCKKPNRQFCDARYLDPDQIHNKCAPVYSNAVAVHVGCGPHSRCASDNDVVVRGDGGHSESETDESKVCKIGNLTMHIGDTLNEGNTPDSVCTKCKCEVPPVPTCMLMEDCDATKIATTPSP